MRLRKESTKRPVEEAGREPPTEFANLTVELLRPVQFSKRYAITNVDSLGVIERFTYAEITRETARWAQLLREKGLQPGDRVVIVAGREWGWRCALLGAIHAGGVAVPCPPSLPLREIRTVVDHADASLLVSLRPRPELVELDGRVVLTAVDLDLVDPAHALEQPPHRTDSRDVALILYAWHGLDLTGTMHTHASLLAQADAAEHWLGVEEDERIWATADDGAGPSIWLLLAAWRRTASIVVVDLELDSEAKLELLDRLRPVAVWFADDEYRLLGSAEVPPWVDLRSIRRALVDTEETEGAISFATAFDAALVPVFGMDELGVVAGWPAGHEGQADATTAQPTPGVQFAVIGGDGTELPPGEVGDIVVRSDAPTLFTGYAGREGRSRSAGWFRFGWRGALTAEGALRVVERSPSEVEPVDATADLPVPAMDEEPTADEPVAAEPGPAALGWRARRVAERERREEERSVEEERRRHEEAEARETAEREAAEAAERERVEAQERAARQAAEAEERRAQEQADERRAQEQADARTRAEAEAREHAEREAVAEAQRAEEERLAEERRLAEQEKRREEEQRQRVEQEERRRAEREAKQRAAAEADERRRAEAEAKHRAEEEKRREAERRLDEKEAREREAREAKEREKTAAEERRRAEEQTKAEQEAAAAETKQRAEEEKRHEKERQREEKEARARAEREAKEREKAEAEERRRAEEEAKIQAKREAAEAKQRAKDEKEREQREAKQRAEREKREAEAAKVQAKIDAADAKQRAKDEKEREKREAVERAEREKAEAEAEKARQRQAEIDAKQRAEEEKRRAKERERDEKEARRRAEQEAKEAARAEREAARSEKRRPREAPPAEDGKRRLGRRREVVEEPDAGHVAIDVVSRIRQYGMAAEERPEALDEEPEPPPSTSG